MLALLGDTAVGHVQQEGSLQGDDRTEYAKVTFFWFRILGIHDHCFEAIRLSRNSRMNGQGLTVWVPPIVRENYPGGYGVLP